jgi:hypothetical protein
VDELVVFLSHTCFFVVIELNDLLIINLT